jgi:hypothetical protein
VPHTCKCSVYLIINTLSCLPQAEDKKKAKEKKKKMKQAVREYEQTHKKLSVSDRRREKKARKQ